ncbi:hypothetical protein Bca4012_085715 [Brassica carinata]
MDDSERILDSQSSVGSKKVEETLVRLQEENLHQFLQLFMCFELGKDQQPAESRQIAGSLLKKSLDADVKRDAFVEQWRSVEDVALKSLIKELLLETLSSSLLEARHTSAQVIAMVASFEIPLNNWPQLVESLVNNMNQQSSLPYLKQSTLEILGYVCENLRHHLKQDEVDSVLAVILQGMNQSENTAEVRVKATTVLFNALDIFRRKFENEVDRTHIINVVCETAFSEKAEIQQAAFGCLVSIASKHYKLSGGYMGRLVEVTASKAASEDEESVALKAIEFWSSICDFEIHCQHESPDSGDSSPPQFINKALPHLVPMLLGKLRKPEEDTDHYDDVLSISMAARECLCLVSRRGGDEIVPLVIPFILTNIRETMSWRDREAAISAFGSILDGSTINKLSTHVPGLLRFLLAAIKDENKDVRDTNASTLNRILHFSYSPGSGSSSAEVVEIFQESINNEQNLPETVSRVLSLCFMMIKHQTGAIDLPQTAESQSSMERLQQHQRVTEHQRVTGSDITVSDSEQLQQSQSTEQQQLRAESQSQMEGLQQHQRQLQRSQSLPTEQQQLRAEQSRSQTAQSQSQMKWLHQHQTAHPRPQQLNVREKLTVSERKSLVELMPLVRGLLDSNGQLEKEMWGISLLEEEKSRPILLKFLRATDFSVTKSLEMLKNTLVWRNTVKINKLCEAQAVVDHTPPSIFIYGHDREGHPVVYDNVYRDFPKNIFNVRAQLEGKVSDFLEKRIIFMETTLRKLGGDSSFLYVFNLQNEHGLAPEDLSLVTELTKEKLKLTQESYPNFVTTQYVQFKMSRIHRLPRSKRDVVMAQTSKSLKTLIKYVKPNEIPAEFGGLSVYVEDMAFEDIGSAISIKAGKRKTVEIQCPNKCEILLKLRSTESLRYESAFIPGTFRTVVGQTSFTPSGNPVFTDMKVMTMERGILRHNFKVTEPGKFVMAGNNPTSKHGTEEMTVLAGNLLLVFFTWKR